MRIQEIAFDVDHQRSEFIAYVPQEAPGQESPGRLCWSLEVYCVNRENERGLSAPMLYAQELTFDVRDWKEMAGQTVRGEGEAGVAAFLDDGLVNSRTADNRLRFLSRQGALFTIEWECLANFFTDDQAAARLPLQLRTELTFDGVHLWWVKADAEGLVAAREIVGRHLDLAGLQEPEIAGPYHIVFPPRLSPTA
jgi:hypothetical protein